MHSDFLPKNTGLEGWKWEGLLTLWWRNLKNTLSGQMARSILTVISQVDIGFLWYYHYICLLPLKTHENGIMRKTSGKIQWRAFHKIANKKSLKVWILIKTKSEELSHEEEPKETWQKWNVLFQMAPWNRKGALGNNLSELWPSVNNNVSILVN